MAVPKSALFDDVYFSADDGYGEARHVFLEGNDLPGSWQGLSNFVITELGFGTGLNFLATWALFDAASKPGQKLHFISFEKYPMAPAEIEKALSPWAHHFGNLLDRLLRHYPIRVPGFHRIILSENVLLTLVFDDVNEALPQLDAEVDCWFLDGFTPAKNPDMWSATVFQEIKRFSVSGASFATFTASGFVKRGLEAAGFAVEKKPGFGRKRDMLAGRFKSLQKRKPPPSVKTVAIIGGGLAGTACAHVLKAQGLQPVVYDSAPHLAAGASGNAGGIYNPRFSALRDVYADLYVASYAQAIRTLKTLGGVDYHPCGSLRLINSDDKAKRFSGTLKNWNWHTDHMRSVEAQEASAIAGVKITQDALYLPDSGFVSPQKLCSAYARDIDVHLNTKIDDLSALQEDAVIVANGTAALNFFPNLPIHNVRGQITYCNETPESKNLQCGLCYGGYLSASLNGQHIVGSTFQKWDDTLDVTQEDHDRNIQNLQDNVPVLANGLKPGAGRAALRTATRDHAPIIGRMEEGVYLSTGHGSHGIVTSLAAAHFLADNITGAPHSLPQSTIAAISPCRFKSLKA